MKGQTKRKNKKVYGGGINDYHLPVYVDGKPIRAYKTWAEMIRRGFCQKFKEKYRVYADCQVCDDWVYFTNFLRWYQDQQHPEGWVLDKDLLVKGNKIYSPTTSLFIEQSLNCFMTESTKARGKYPLGISFREKTGRYIAQCHSATTNKETHIGCFLSLEDAVSAYKNFKWDQALIWIERVTNDNRYDSNRERIIEALEVRYNPKHIDTRDTDC